MKILLIYPQYSHSSEFDSRAPSMSLLYLAAKLEQDGHEIRIYDASLGPITRQGRTYRYGNSDQEVEAFLQRSDFDFVGITCSFNARWKFVKKIAQLVKMKSARIPVAVGGLYPTSQWEYCLSDCPEVDLILLGEAELTFLEIVGNYARAGQVPAACQTVEGVAWREGTTRRNNPKTKYNESLDDLPFPAWHLVDLGEYARLQRTIFDLPQPCLPLLSSRGCPNRCRFCNMFITNGPRWRPRSAKNVLDEIDYLIRRFGVKRFYFIDDNFSIDLKRAKEICQGIIDRKIKIKYNFHNGLSIKALDLELIRLLKRSGCTSVCLGIESGSEKVRNGIYRKGLSTDKIIQVVEWFDQVGIPAVGYFLVGAPGETREDFEESKKLMARLPLRLVTVSLFTPYPDTELYDECCQKGWLKELSADDESRVEMFTSMVETPDFTPEEVARWQKELYLSFIRAHWWTLLKEAFRPGGLVNKDMLGKFVGMLRFRGERADTGIKP